MPGVANAHVAALERDGRVVFLYAVRPGPADRAYGVQVARLAGLPPWVADRAQGLLAELAARRETATVPAPSPPQGEPRVPEQTPIDDGQPAATSSAAPPDGNRLIADSPGPPYQLALGGFPAGLDGAGRLATELRELDLSQMTPREALDWLFDQQRLLGGPRPDPSPTG